MDFGLLPPEINSGRMYSGPGSGPLLAAAAAWDDLGAQLHLTTYSYRSVIGEMAADWRGPSAAAMAVAVESYAAWMSHAAVAAEESASQARTAAAAFEAAFAATVPPSVVAANRAELMVLVATNFFGQNTPAIMTTEAHYAAMWAQDATAMAGYAGSSAGATQMAPFEPPPQITNPTAPVAAATSTSSTTADLIAIDKFISGPLSPSLLYGIGAIPELLGGQGYLLPQAVATLISGPTAAALPEATSTGAIQAPMLVGAGGLTAVAAQAGRAELVGRLSVPQSWTEPVALMESTTSLAAGSDTIAPADQMASAALLADEEAGMFGAPGTPMLAGRALTTAGSSAAPPAGPVGSTSTDTPAPAENVSNIFVIRESNKEGID